MYTGAWSTYYSWEQIGLCLDSSVVLRKAACFYYKVNKKTYVSKKRNFLLLFINVFTYHCLECTEMEYSPFLWRHINLFWLQSHKMNKDTNISFHGKVLSAKWQLYWSELNLLIHWGRVTHVCINQLDHHWYRYMACPLFDAMPL